jgi:3-oxoacyl-[acyl-carrier protein] reductase
LSGSSGIGRGIAKCFSEKGANVCITGTKDSIDQYDEDLDEVIKSCHYRTLDLSNYNNIEELSLPFDSLDALICSQGIVAYKRKEFEMDTFKRVVDLNLNSIMASCT